MKECADSAMNMLTQRLIWESKNRLFYRMVHDGLPRVNKPFPSASDAHYPLIDMTIRKLKPFYIGQMLSGDKLCSFTSLKEQLDTISEAAADYYDFISVNKSKLVQEIDRAVYFMLRTGRGVIKSTIDPLDGYKLVDESIDPYFILMPQSADDFEDADEFVHVRMFTVPSYKRLDDRYDKEPATIEKIRGSKDWLSLGLYNQDMRLQQGIAWTSQPNQILVYEHYVKTGGGWTVHTYCPMAPDLDLRKPYGVPYKVNGKVVVPFVSFPMEMNEAGWYAPRGISELIAPVEQYLTKLWNEKADAMTFANRPLYTGDKEIVNSANYRWAPGEYIPGNIRGVQQGTPPFNFDQEIGFARSIAEQQSQSPDFGITDNSGAQDTSKPRTATENQRISALQQTGTNYQGSLFRQRLTKMHTNRWGLICQFKEREFAYYAAGQISQVPEQALHDEYLIAPDGTVEGWNKLASFQKAVGLMQTFQGNPNSDNEYWTKKAMGAADARSVIKGGFIPTNLKGASEYEDEAMIISSLIVPGSGKPSFPATVKPTDDQPSRIKALLDWIHAAQMKGTPVDPQSRMVLQQRIAQRLQFLHQSNPAAASALKKQIGQMEQASAATQTPDRNGSLQPNQPPPMTPQ